MDRFGKLSWLIVRWAQWSLCAGGVLLFTGCASTPLLTPGGFTEPPAVELKAPGAPATPPTSSSEKPATEEAPAVPPEEKAWITELLASRHGEITLHDALLIAID